MYNYKTLTAKQAKELLAPIPNDKFITDAFTDGYDKCCGIGHLKRLTSDNPKNYNRENCSDKYGLAFLENAHDADGFRRQTYLFLMSKGYKSEHDPETIADMAAVNNYKDVNGYTEYSIKDRIIHLLNDMEAAGY